LRRFITAEDHYLPPDNYQEQPVQAVAHRTSPTNIGLSLLASLSAYDFGYIPVKDTDRTDPEDPENHGTAEEIPGSFFQLV
jgi:cyclic beta-1,2-glucan synthetase